MRGLEDQKPCPSVCRLVASGPLLGGLFWSSIGNTQISFAPARTVVRGGEASLPPFSRQLSEVFCSVFFDKMGLVIGIVIFDNFGQFL